jgi:hypothetical protein
MSKVLITLVYYLVFVPVSAFVRLLHDPLDRAWDAERETYWSFTEEVGAGSPLEARDASSSAHAVSSS